MKEIIYVQAGKLSNYVGTHFWNTQEAYLAEESAAAAIYDIDVSFRERAAKTGTSTFYPRLLVFDRKVNFGTLSPSNALLGSHVGEPSDGSFPEMWHENITDYRQDRIEQSDYHASLNLSHENDDSALINVSPQNVRYWSDFSHVYYLPRTIQRVRDYADWINFDGNWNHGQTEFMEHDEEHGLMENSLRLFFEECDSPQGIQVMNDTASFGGFMYSFFTSFRDEYPKLSCLAVPLLSDAMPHQFNPNNIMTTRLTINDALYLRSLNEMASVSIPIQPPSLWTPVLWNRNLTAQVDNVYHTSAVLSAMIETSTLPLRLKANKIDLAELSTRLSCRGSNSFGQLSGILPFQSAEDFEAGLSNLSAITVGHPQYTRLDVTRGFNPSGISAYDKWATGQRLEGPSSSSVHTSPYPIATSFPSLFRSPEGPIVSDGNAPRQPNQCSMFSSLSVGRHTALLFSSYASAIKTYLNKKSAADALGHDKDELFDLLDDLWTLHAHFSESDDAGQDDVDVLGEDE